MTPPTVTISGGRTNGSIQSLGAMAGPFTFTLADGRAIAPLAVAPWHDDPSEKLAALPPLLRRLRGEWPCVPFGGTTPPENLPQDWLESRHPVPRWHEHDHGYSSNAAWNVVGLADDRVTLSIQYPDDHPVASPSRTIVCHPTEPSIAFTLTITPRQDTIMPVRLHPVFRLPERVGAAHLVVDDVARFWTFPVDVEPGKSALMANQRNVERSGLRSATGAVADITRLPLPGFSEDLVLATGTNGTIAIENHEERYVARLDWNAADLPGCVFWLSNRGRAFYPWNTRFCAVGIEPVAAPFDLGPAFTGPGTPLARSGMKTGVALAAGESGRRGTRYRCLGYRTPKVSKASRALRPSLMPRAALFSVETFSSAPEMTACGMTRSLLRSPKSRSRVRYGRHQFRGEPGNR